MFKLVLEKAEEPEIKLPTSAESLKKKNIKLENVFYAFYTKKIFTTHDGMNTHLEPDILEHEVKWALGSVTMNTASGGDGIPVELLQILKDDAVKVLHSKICQQIWKTQQ